MLVVYLSVRSRCYRTDGTCSSQKATKKPQWEPPSNGRMAARKVPGRSGSTDFPGHMELPHAAPSQAGRIRDNVKSACRCLCAATNVWLCCWLRRRWLQSVRCKDGRREATRTCSYLRMPTSINKTSSVGAASSQRRDRRGGKTTSSESFRGFSHSDSFLTRVQAE